MKIWFDKEKICLENDDNHIIVFSGNEDETLVTTNKPNVEFSFDIESKDEVEENIAYCLEEHIALMIGHYFMNNKLKSNPDISNLFHGPKQQTITLQSDQNKTAIVLGWSGHNTSICTIKLVQSILDTTPIFVLGKEANSRYTDIAYEMKAFIDDLYCVAIAVEENIIEKKNLMDDPDLRKVIKKRKAKRNGNLIEVDFKE